MAVGTRLVGRDTEIRRTMRALQESRLVAVSGASGVGKSRLLSELLARHGADRVPVYSVVASDAMRSAPLSPLIALLDDVPDDLSLVTAAVLRAVRERAGPHGRQLIVVDDAHHLDEASVAALSVILAGSSAKMLLALRDDVPCPDSLTDMLREDAATRVDVSALDRDDTRLLVRECIGVADDRLHDRVWDLTRGNPLLVRELLSGAADQLDQDAAGRWSVRGALVSPTVADLVRTRLRRLGSEQSTALELVAVGAPLPLDLLTSAVAGRVVDELAALGLLDVVPHGTHEEVTPGHPLYGEVLRDSIGPQRQHELRDQLVVAALDSQARIDRVRVATWQAESGRVRDVELALDGVRAALGRYMGDLAERLLDSVADLAPAPVIALLRASTLVQQGQTEQAEAVLLAVDRDDVDERTAVELTSVRAFNLAFGLGEPARADAVLAHGISAAGAGEHRLAAERGIIAGIAGDFTPAREAASRTLASSRADPVMRTSAHVAMSLVETMRGHCDEVTDLAGDGVALALATSGRLPFARDQIESMHAISELMAGRIAEALDLSGRAAHDPERALLHWLWRAIEAACLAPRGDLVAARHGVDLAMRQQFWSRLLDLPGIVPGVAGIVRGHGGSSEGLAELESLRSTRRDARNTAWLDRGRAWLHAAAGDVERAGTISITSGRELIEQDHRCYGIFSLHDAVRLGSVAHAREVADLLDDAVAQTHGAHLASVTAAHARAAAQGDPEGLADVARRFALQGAFLLAAEAAAQSATSYRARGEDAAERRTAAWSMGWERQCREVRTPALQARPRTGLTGRVLQTAVAAAAGAGSAELAAELQLSVRTIDNHLGSAYRHFGVNRRTQLVDVLGPLVT